MWDVIRLLVIIAAIVLLVPCAVMYIVYTLTAKWLFASVMGAVVLVVLITVAFKFVGSWDFSK